MSSAETLIRVEGVSKKFSRSLRRSLWYGVKDVGSELIGSRRRNPTIRSSEFWALQDVNFELKRGESLALVGANGSGKSTMLRLINGLVKPTTGKIEVSGRIQALIALGVGFSSVLTGRENVYVAASILGISKRETDRLYDSIVEFSGVEDFIEAPVQTYSSGMLVRLGFSIATHVSPDILLVDEVLAVGDDAFRQKALTKMYEMLDRATVIFVSHNLNHVEQLCERTLYFRTGEPPIDGKTHELIGQYISETNSRLVEEESGRDSALTHEGSGDIVITGHSAFVDDVETATMKSGQRLKIRINFEVKNQITRPVWFVAIIMDPATGAMVLTNSYHDTVTSQGGYVDIEFPNLTLRPRTYPVQLVITESAVTIDRIRRAFVIAVDTIDEEDPAHSQVFKKDLVYWPGPSSMHCRIESENRPGDEGVEQSDQ